MERDMRMTENVCLQSVLDLICFLNLKGCRNDRAPRARLVDERLALPRGRRAVVTRGLDPKTSPFCMDAGLWVYDD